MCKLEFKVLNRNCLWLIQVCQIWLPTQKVEWTSKIDAIDLTYAQRLIDGQGLEIQKPGYFLQLGWIMRCGGSLAHVLIHAKHLTSISKWGNHLDQYTLPRILKIYLSVCLSLSPLQMSLCRVHTDVAFLKYCYHTCLVPCIICMLKSNCTIYVCVYTYIYTDMYNTSNAWNVSGQSCSLLIILVSW
jgi:hypothetical protein